MVFVLFMLASCCFMVLALFHACFMLFCGVCKCFVMLAMFCGVCIVSLLGRLVIFISRFRDMDARPVFEKREEGDEFFVFHIRIFCYGKGKHT